MAAKFSIFLCLLSIWVTILASAASSHHAPAPSVDCSSLVLTMADCLSFVSNGSTTTKPEGNCCSGLKTVLKADPACLCEAFKSSAQYGVVLNNTKAVTLPAACKVSAPSATNCALSTTPAAAPAGALSPESSPTSAATGAPGVASAASEPSSAPTPSPGSSAASIPFSAGTLLVGLVLAMFSSFKN